MENDLKHRTFVSLVWKLLERGGNQVVQLLVQIVMARLLSPDVFGALAILLVFVNIGNTIVQSGLNASLVQAKEAGEEDYSTVFWMCLTVSVILYAVAFFAAPALAGFYGSPGLVWPLRVLCLVLVVGAFNSVQVAVVSRELAFKKVFTVTIVAVAASGTLGIALAFAGAGLWALVGQQLVYQFASCAALLFQVRWIPRLVFRRNLAVRHYRFGWKLLVSGLLDTGYQSLSDLVIGKQFSQAELGLVSQGKKYPQALGSMLDGAIQPVMMSAVSRLQNDVGQVKRLVRRALKTSTYIIVPAMALFALMAEPLVGLLLGERWLPCVPFLQMYCFVYALLPIHTTNLQALNGMGRSDLFLKLEVVKKAYGVVVLCVTAFVLKSPVAIVAGYMLTGVVSTFVNAFPNRRVIGYSYSEQLRDVVPAVLLTAVSAVAAWPLSLLGLASATQIVLQALTMGTVYLLLSRLFRVEEFGYLVAVAKGFLASRLGREG